MISDQSFAPEAQKGDTMKTRREVIKLLIAVAAGISTFMGKLGTGIQLVFAEAKRRLLAKDTPMSALISQMPTELDTSNLEITPLEEFDTMGQTNYTIAKSNWRLKVTGAVANSLDLTFEELATKPMLERNVLLICPGFFAHHGRWKGVSAAVLLAEAGISPLATEVEFSGPKGARGRSERFPLEEIRSGKVFLAYGVNGHPLPQKHGFPLRLVAEDHYGSRWVKYVDKITVI